MGFCRTVEGSYIISVGNLRELDLDVGQSAGQCVDKGRKACERVFVCRM